MENAVVFHMDMLSSAYALDQIQTNLIQPVQNGSIQFPRCLRKNEPAFEPVRKSYEEIRNVFGGDSFRENYYDGEADRKSTRLNSSHDRQSRMPSSA